MKSSCIGAILIGLSSLISFNLVAADSAAGKSKSAVCAGCHGADGNSANGVWPILAGQHASYLEKQLKGLVIVVDIRRGIGTLDWDLIEMVGRD